MTTVKTAISIDAQLMKEVDAWVVDLKISRSRIFALGVEKLIQQYENQRMLEAINKVYDDLPADGSSADGSSDNEYEHLEAMYKEFDSLMVDEKW